MAGEGVQLAALRATEAPQADVVAQYVEQLQDVSMEASTTLIDQIRALVESEDSLEAVRARLLQLDLSTETLAEAMSQALQAAALAGRYELLEEAR